MSARLVYIDPDRHYVDVIKTIQHEGIECIELKDDLNNLFQYILGGQDILFVADEDTARLPVISAASSLMHVVTAIEPVIEGTQWSVMPVLTNSSHQADFLLGLFQRGSEGRIRTRIPMACKLWIAGTAHSVTNATVREFWLSSTAMADSLQTFDGIIELPDTIETIAVKGSLVAKRHDGCAVQVEPIDDLGLLKWLEFFSKTLENTPNIQQIELIDEFFKDSNC